jgi:hypothetical protein
MHVGIVFLRIYNRDSGHVYDLFHSRRTLQDVDRTTHSHQDRADQFSAADLRRQLAGNVRRS